MINNYNVFQNGWTALEWARFFENQECETILGHAATMQAVRKVRGRGLHMWSVAVGLSGGKC